MSSQDSCSTDLQQIVMELDLFEDIAAELEDFILLSKLGVTDEAFELVDAVLVRHIRFFPVFAEITGFLIDNNHGSRVAELFIDFQRQQNAASFTNEDDLFLNIVELYIQDDLPRTVLKALGHVYNDKGVPSSSLQELLASPAYDSPVQASDSVLLA